MKRCQGHVWLRTVSNLMCPWVFHRPSVLILEPEFRFFLETRARWMRDRCRKRESVCGLRLRNGRRVPIFVTCELGAEI